MTEPSKGGNPFSLVMLVTLLIGGVVLENQLSLQGSRPVLKSKIHHQHLDEEDVDARLWQDPFQAVDQAIEHIEKEHPNEPRRDRWPEFQRSLQQKYKSDPVTILGVMVSSGPNFVDAENRIRTRYAVVSGLASSGYRPVTSEYIGYLEGKDWLHVHGKLTEHYAHHHMPERVPYEWFEPIEKGLKDARKPWVLVVWLDDRHIFHKEMGTLRPLRNIQTLFQHLVAQKDTTNEEFHSRDHSHSKEEDAVHLKEGDYGKFRFVVIGPPHSGQLGDMVREGLNIKYQGPIPNIPSIEILSTRATKDEQQILRRALKHSSNLSVSKYFDDKNVRFLRTTPTDLELAMALVKELKLRGVSGASPIALVSEWDTDYGRAFQKTICKAWKTVFPVRGKRLVENEGPCTYLNNIYYFSYLRGLDGQLPEPASNEKEKKKPYSKELNLGSEVSPTLRAERERQYDYLVRLAEKIGDTEKQLDPYGDSPRTLSNPRFEAFGVLGSDYYDKLVVLQALRRQFSHAHFFTTDMDARFFHAQDYKYVRNLIVASGFGLSLREDIQKSIPPFRDTYQTSAYLATRLAVDSDPSCHLVSQESLDQLLQPRVFEVGRTQAFDLSENQDLNRNICSVTRVPVSVDLGSVNEYPISSLHPQPAPLFPPSKFIGLIVLMGLLVFLVYLKFKKYWRGITWGAYVLGWFVIYIVLLDLNGGEEPLAFFEGVSLWPTDFFRLTGVLLAVAYVGYVDKKLLKDWKEIKSTFKTVSNETVSEEKESTRTFRAKLKYIWKLISATFLEDKGQKKAQGNSTVWIPYSGETFWCGVILRSLGFIGVGLIIMCLFGFAFVPVRGDFSRLLDLSILVLFILSFAISLFYTGVHFNESTGLIQFLKNRRNRPDWNDETVKNVFENLDVSGFNRGPSSSQIESSRTILNDLITLRLIGKRTDISDELIYFPFSIMAVGLLSRARIFDNWDFPLTLMSLFIYGAGYLFYKAWCIQREAKKCKEEVIGKLKTRQIHYKVQGQSYLEELTSLLIEDTQNYKQGAFLPFIEHPFFKAMLLPFSGFGAMALLEYLFLAV